MNNAALTRHTAAKFVWKFGDEVVVDAIFQRSEDDHWSRVLHCMHTVQLAVKRFSNRTVSRCHDDIISIHSEGDISLEHRTQTKTDDHMLMK